MSGSKILNYSQSITIIHYSITITIRKLVIQTICKNIAMENYEQWEANQPFDSRPRVIDRKDLGDGRTEAS